MIHKKSLLLVSLLCASLATFDASAMSFIKNIAAFLKNRPGRSAFYGAGFAMAGWIGFSVYRWFRQPQLRLPEPPQVPDVVGPKKDADHIQKDKTAEQSQATKDSSHRRVQTDTNLAASFPVLPKEKSTQHRRIQSDSALQIAKISRLAFKESAKLESLPPVVVDSSMSGRQYKSIFEAALHGTKYDVEQFVSQGISVDAQDSVGLTPLCCAVYGNNIDVARYLLETGADVNLACQTTPLHVASTPEILELLLKHQPKICQDKSGRTIFHLAARRPDLINVLVTHVYPGTLGNHLIASYDVLGYSPLMYSLQSGDLDCIKALMKCITVPGALHGHTSRYHGKLLSGDNLLHLAVQLNLKLVQMLVEDFDFKSIIDNQNRTTGETALHIALKAKRLDIAQYLVAQGACYDIKDTTRKTAQDLAGWYQLTIPVVATSSVEPVEHQQQETRLEETDSDDEMGEGYDTVVIRKTGDTLDTEPVDESAATVTTTQLTVKPVSEKKHTPLDDVKKTRPRKPQSSRKRTSSRIEGRDEPTVEPRKRDQVTVDPARQEQTSTTQTRKPVGGVPMPGFGRGFDPAAARSGLRPTNKKS